VAEEQSLHKLVQTCTYLEKSLKNLDANWEINRKKMIPILPGRYFFVFGEISDSVV